MSQIRQSRRRFLGNASALGAGLLLHGASVAAEPGPEIRRLRIQHDPFICLAPQLLAREFLLSEGFTEVEYVASKPGELGLTILAENRADLTTWDVPSLLPAVESGTPVVALAGIHAGCWELFGNDSVHAVRDIKGKRVAIHALLDFDHTMVASLLAYVGIDPQREVEWVMAPTYDATLQLFVDGKADAIMCSAPRPQQLRARKIGHVLVNGVQDRPWSQYFCCAVVGNRDFVSRHPIAAKRALRAILKATDVCAQDPQRAARYLVEQGAEPRYELALEVLRSLPYSRWRDTHPEDSLRFFALRLREAGMIKTTPQKLIAQGADWRPFNELRRELKA
jgi:NitT/TauT family transport system substrate-binding protein